MKNQYEINESSQEAIIWLHRRDGSVWGCRIDLEDLEIVSSIDGTWCAAWDSESQTFYAVHSHKIAGKSKTTLMHRLIMSAPPGREVDHLEHNGLDNRKTKLALKNRSGNALNRRGANSNNKSGLRGVYFHKKTASYRGWVRVDGKRKEFGRFPTAGAAAHARAEFLNATQKGA